MAGKGDKNRSDVHSPEFGEFYDRVFGITSKKMDEQREALKNYEIDEGRKMSLCKDVS